MEHPRARVTFEERGQVFPGWILRYAYKPLVNPTKNMFERAMNCAFRAHPPGDSDLIRPPVPI